MTTVEEDICGVEVTLNAEEIKLFFETTLFLDNETFLRHDTFPRHFSSTFFDICAVENKKCREETANFSGMSIFI